VQLNLFGFRDAHTFPATSRARQFESGSLLRSMKYEKAVPYHSPRQKFLVPVCSSHEIGWEAEMPDNMDSARRSTRHPRLNSHITLHAEKMALEYGHA